MHCLYCGKESWLPARFRSDPDFCNSDHREKYHARVDLAIRRIKGSPQAPVVEPVPPPVVKAPAPKVPAPATRVTPRPRNVPAPSLPRLNLSPSSDSWEDVPAAAPARPSARRTDEQEPQIFTMLEAAASGDAKARRLALTAIGTAAGLAAVIWLGTSAFRLGRDLLSHNAAPGTSQAAPAPVAAAPSLPSQPGALRHPLAWVRSVAIQHATTHYSESFDHGMAAWGVRSREWAPGWSHSPDGYVHPGQLALYQPSLGFADYRMEFFGLIENKSMSWVLRAKDSRNYYVMRINLVKGGLRPLLSMVHYPVVNGRAGQPVNLPLSIMVHNDTPYHVAVEVHGNRYTASIEGEEIDSWTDDSLPAGGVGFFAEPGARARVYWLKVSSHNDWVGWFCEHIAGGSAPPGASQGQEQVSVNPLSKFLSPAGTRTYRRG